MKKIINYIAPALSIAALVLALMTFSITKARGAEECDVLKLDRSLKDSFFAEWFDLGCYEVEDCCYDMHTTTCNGYTRMYWVENRANHTYFPWHYVEHIAMRDWYGGLRLETREHVYHTSYAIKMVVITEMVDSDLDGSLDYFDRHVHYEDVDIYNVFILDLPAEYPGLRGPTILSEHKQRVMFDKEVEYWSNLHKGRPYLRNLDMNTTRMVACLDECRLEGFGGDKCIEWCSQWGAEE